MRIVELLGTDGRAIPCWEPRPNFYVACSTWTEEEARQYAETGCYPERLAQQIRDQLA